jgi:polysaccharide export outer membrane protein
VRFPMSLLGAMLLFAVSAGPGLAQQTTDTLAALKSGDVVRITVWRNPELSGEFRIMADGAIGHPLYQAVNVRGVSLPTLTARLREFLATYAQNAQVVVEPMLRVSVGGEVRTPSLYVIPFGTTVGQAIAQAGGASELGNLRRVRLVREGREQRIDLADIRTNAAAMPVQSGDEIYVARRGARIGDIIGPLASVVAAVAAIVSITR